MTFGLLDQLQANNLSHVEYVAVKLNQISIQAKANEAVPVHATFQIYTKDNI